MSEIMSTQRPGTAQTAPAMVNTYSRGADMTQRTCSVDGCGRRFYSRGWCNPHYQRWLRTGIEPSPSRLERLRPADAIATRHRVDENGCHVWTGCINADGYGDMGAGLAHRVAWEMERGPIPPGLDIDHLCRNRACINVRHLESVSHQVNAQRGSDARRAERRLT